MATRILEGTWEEILAHHETLSGKHVRVIVLDPHEVEPKNLIEFLGDFVGSLSLECPDTAERVDESFSAIVLEKHSRRSETDERSKTIVDTPSESSRKNKASRPANDNDDTV